MEEDWKAVVDKVDIIMRMVALRLQQGEAAILGTEQIPVAMAVVVAAAGTAVEPIKAHRQYPHPTIPMMQVVDLAVLDMYIHLQQQATTQADVC